MPSNPINIYGATLFTRAQDNAIKRGFNNAPGVTDDLDEGVDADVQERLLGGICSGITSTWVIRLINGIDDARVSAQFIEFFDNVARFQGAYFKDCHGRIDSHLKELGKIFDAKIKHEKDLADTAFTAGDMPQLTRWGAYVSAYGHAIGAGRYLNEFYLMDPNVGLLIYGDVGSMTEDLNDFVKARAVKKGKVGVPAKLFIYKRG